MSRPSILVLGATMTLVLAACSGATVSGTGGAGSPEPASVAPVSAAPGSAACASSTDAGTEEVSIAGRAFSPDRIEAKVGDVIVFTNADSVPHTATLDDGSCSTESLNNGATGALTFSAAGEYAFHCRIHGSMTGTFVISD